MVENCHNGPNEPTLDWQPFHMYRISTDIAPVFGSILANINEIPRIATANLSFPGIWAYPGNTNLSLGMLYFYLTLTKRSNSILKQT